MAQYITLNVKLSNLQLDKLRPEIKNGTNATLNLSSYLIGDSNDEDNFPYKLLLNDAQISRIRKDFANGLSSTIIFSKTQLSKMVQLGGRLGRPLAPLLKTGLPLIGNALKSLAKSVLVLLGLTAPAAATDATIQKKMFESAMPILITWNEEMDEIMKMIKSLKESGLLIKEVSEKVKNEAKEQKGEFLGIF